MALTRLRGGQASTSSRPVPCPFLAQVLNAVNRSRRPVLRGARGAALSRPVCALAAHGTYQGVANTARQATLEDDVIDRRGLAQFPPETFTAVDEYDGPNDLGFWRMDVEDQTAFICTELDLTDEQALYLLHALGLLPEGAPLPDYGQQRRQDEPRWEGGRSSLPPDMPATASHEGEELSVRDALESWQADSDDEGVASYAVARPGSEHLGTDEPSFPADLEGEVEAALDPSSSGADAVPIATHVFTDPPAEHHDHHHHHGANGNGAGPHFNVSIRPNIVEAKPSGHKVAPGVPALAFDQSTFDRDYEVIQLRVIGRRSSTAAAMGEEIELAPGKLIAGRYQVLEQVGAAAFSRAVQAYDTLERRLVCLKVVKNDKECMDACLEEVRLLQMINARDPRDEHHIARLYDYFYHLGHLFLVVELLGGNLFDTQCYDPSYFTPGRMQSIARQVLQGLSFLHSNHIIHADVKPENILVKNYSKCSVKLIDLGCSIYNSEAHMSHYVQSRSYRAPEVMLGLPYDGRIDIWSLGCVMAELATGQVLFPNVSEAAMLARMVGILGDFPPHMVADGQYAGAFFTRSSQVYERDPETGLFQLLVPKRTTVQARVPSPDRGMLHFIKHLLVLDPAKRPTAEQALRHPWLQYRYRSPK